MNTAVMSGDGGGPVRQLDPWHPREAGPNACGGVMQPREEDDQRAPLRGLAGFLRNSHVLGRPMSTELFMRWLESSGPLDVRVVAALATMFIVAAFLPIPRTMLVLGAGAAYGIGALLVIVPSTTLGCILAFLAARRLFSGWVARQIAKRPMWQLIAQAIDAEGWRIAALLRFWGPLPNSAQNYLLGLTGIGLLPYSLITLFFTLPQIILYTYVGASGRSLLLDDGPAPLTRLFMVLAAIVMLIIVVIVSRQVKNILAQRLVVPSR